MVKETSLTFEKLYELTRREKTTSEIQKLPDNFFEELNAYFKSKIESFESVKKDSAFTSLEIERLSNQIKAAKRIARDLIEKRLAKIADLALFKFYNPSIMIDTSLLQEKEKKIFDEFFEKISKFHGEFEFLDYLKSKKIKSDETKILKNELKSETKEPKSTHVRFLSALEIFYGEDYEEYGPFEAGDTAWLPNKIAKILIDQGKAEEI